MLQSKTRPRCKNLIKYFAAVIRLGLIKFATGRAAKLGLKNKECGIQRVWL